MKRPPTPMPATARPTMRALLLCAVAHTKDLSHDMSAPAIRPARTHLPKLKDSDGREKGILDLVRVSAEACQWRTGHGLDNIR